ncbi:type I restriction-modification system subunit M [Xanthovirga aplysinae]|uniref:type I restriction-modification system subunit M n=1 Tax=Xanthovirga aplysinae TaxID=2529853 RepID=UPI0012BBF9ED|nr:class I SAM-dependent DNA methyltransferase [Xanthovirga aplysinae]MTI31691.1 SAM-dependent DNA methyltransferase [Xanthovirga aplysinae]
MKNFKESANFIWSIADLLRGDYKQSDYGKVILPLTVLRRLDCVLENTKEKVLSMAETLTVDNVDPILNKVAGYKFHNRSKFDFDKLVADPNNIAANLRNYINGFSEDAREIIEQFEFDNQISKMDDNNLLFLVVKRFQEVDLHPETISSMEMGYMFEELIRKFAELSNETAGEHFTPREVIRLMVNILFLNDRDILTKKGIVKTIYDCCAGTGGMLSVAEEYLNELNPDARLEVFGQELNPESYAICKSDMLIKGQNASNIKKGNSISEDQLAGKTFDYLITNPPFGVKWDKIYKKVKEEHDELGHGGRFGAGLPAKSDGSFLFLMSLISKMKQDEKGSKLAIVFNGSPLFSGSPSSKKNESSIRQWIIESDMLEAIIALPNQLFYNTGISTYIWVVNNRKAGERKGKVQLINAVDFFQKMSKSLGSKRNELSEEQIREITEIYGGFEEGKYCKIFDNEDFGYHKLTVERPLYENGKKVVDRKGNPKADAKLRDTENVPLKEDITDYMQREVLPHVPDAWTDEKKSLVGYEINFTKYFYEYQPLRSLGEIKADILALEEETNGMVSKVMA